MKKNAYFVLLFVLFCAAFSACSKSSSSSFSKNAVLINEVMPKAASDGYEWIELVNNSKEAVSISGFEIENERGTIYVIPDELQALPVNSVLLIKFDGSDKSDDFDFNDGKAELHVAPGDAGFFDDAAGYVAMYKSATHDADNIISFISLGEPQDGAQADAVSAGIWQSDKSISFARGGGSYSNSDLLTANESIGMVPSFSSNSLSAFAVYRGNNVTEGKNNPSPLPSYFSPYYDESVENAEPLLFSWASVEGADSYLFELSYDNNFSINIKNESVTKTSYELAAGTSSSLYYWRVTPIAASAGDASKSAATFQPFSPIPVKLINSNDIINSEIDLKLPFLYQRKDTAMLCLGGCDMDDDATSNEQTAWNVEHLGYDTDAAVLAKIRPAADPHSNSYCVPAVISMLNSYYGGTLSQDRISYHTSKEVSSLRSGFPLEYDLWHGMSSDFSSLAWALGLEDTCQGALDCSPYMDYYGEKLDFDTLMTELDAGRPLIANMVFGQAVIIDGYKATLTGNQIVHIIDPWSGERWTKYEKLDIQYVIVLPAKSQVTAPVSDEASVSEDTDSDGIVDFDETNRLLTKTDTKDSDADGLGDLTDIMSYLFDSTGKHKFSAEAISPLKYEGDSWVENTTNTKKVADNADYDNDGKRMELDSDNDDDGSIDGCEDYNLNGLYDTGDDETSNFDASSVKTCQPILTLSAINMDFGADKDTVEITISNPKHYLGEINYSVKIDEDWLRIADTSLSSGTIKDGIVKISFAVSRRNLQVQSYTTMLHFTSDANNIDVPVTMEVSSLLDIVFTDIASSEDIVYDDSCTTQMTTTDISSKILVPTGNTLSKSEIFYRFSTSSTWETISMGYVTVSDNYSATIGPFVLVNGTVEYYLYAEDSAGNSATSEIYRFMVHDCEAPMISDVTHYYNKMYLKGCNIASRNTVSCKVVDTSGISVAYLKYRVNLGDYQQIEMSAISSDKFAAEMGPFSFTGLVTYYIEVIDNFGNSSISSEHDVEVFDCSAMPITVSSVSASPANSINTAGTDPDTVKITCLASANKGTARATIYTSDSPHSGVWSPTSMTYDAITDAFWIELGPYDDASMVYYYITIYDTTDYSVDTDIFWFTINSP